MCLSTESNEHIEEIQFVIKCQLSEELAVRAINEIKNIGSH